MVTIASVRAHGVRRFKLTCERHLAASTTAVLREAGPLVFAATRRAQHAEDVHSHWQLFRERLSRQSQFPTWLWVKSRHLRAIANIYARH